MSKRYVLFAATAVLAVSLAVPAFGGPSNPVADTFASAKKTAKKALKKANKANKAAKNAQNSADGAQSTANGAQSTADDALSAANTAQGAADGAQTTADQAITDAAAAKAAADAAQVTADSKYGNMSLVNGDSSASNSTTPKVVSAGCGSSEVTGGGHIINGAGANDVTVTLTSQYGSGWIVQAQEIGAGTGDNWSISASVKCIAP